MTYPPAPGAPGNRPGPDRPLDPRVPGGAPPQQGDPTLPGGHGEPGAPAGADPVRGGGPGAAPGPDAGPESAGPEQRPTPAGFDDRGRVRRTRVSGVWIGLILIAVLLILLIIFIAQNSQSVSIHFLGFNGHISAGLALLIAGVAGLLIAAVPGSIRIFQLRRALRRNVKHPVEPDQPRRR